jgi:hypothetical protein
LDRYNGYGHRGRSEGAIISGVQIVNVMLMFVLIDFLTFPLIWLYSVYDAYKTAQSR